MHSSEDADLKARLLPQATALVEKATGGTQEKEVIEALINACQILEDSASSDAPLVALERDVPGSGRVYHLFVRRLSSSIPAGKFQILITRDLASGLIY